MTCGKRSRDRTPVVLVFDPVKQYPKLVSLLGVICESGECD